MVYRTMHPQFASTFQYFNGIPEQIKEAMWNYMAHGIDPGGFCRAVLLCNFQLAMARADSHWTIGGLKSLAKWIDNYVPRVCYGTDEAIEKWIALTDEERRDIMIELNLRPSEFDILRGHAVA